MPTTGDIFDFLDVPNAFQNTESGNITFPNVDNPELFDLGGFDNLLPSTFTNQLTTANAIAAIEDAFNDPGAGYVSDGQPLPEDARSVNLLNQLRQQAIFYDTAADRVVTGADVERTDPSTWQRFAGNLLRAVSNDPMKAVGVAALLAGGAGLAGAGGLSGTTQARVGQPQLTPQQQQLMDHVVQQAGGDAARRALINPMFLAALRSGVPEATLTGFVNLAKQQSDFQGALTGMVQQQLPQVTAAYNQEAVLRGSGVSNLSNIINGTAQIPSYLQPTQRSANAANDLLYNALTGNAPVDPRLEREIGLRRNQLQNDVVNAMGPGGNQSSMGLRAWQLENESEDAARMQARQQWAQIAGNAANQSNQNLFNQLQNVYGQNLSAAQLNQTQQALQGLQNVGGHGAPTAASFTGTVFGADPAAVANSGVASSANALNGQLSSLAATGIANANAANNRNTGLLSAGAGILGAGARGLFSF